MSNFFTVTYMVRVVLHHTEVALKVLMGRTEKISLVVWVVSTINLWD